MALKLEGIISAMLTPFTKNGAYVDFDKIAPFAERLIKSGVHGLFPCGTTGEGQLLTPEERKEIVEEVVATAGKRVKVIAHTGAMDTATTIELTRHARDCGADGASIVAPGFYAYDDASLAKYYKAVARAVDGFPVLLYNIPSCAKNELSAELVLDLAESVDNIIGIKDSSGSMPRLTRLLGAAPKGFHIINGCDEYGYQAFLAGVPAVVSGTSNVVPELYVGIHEHVKKGNLKKAWKLQVTLERAARVFQYGRMSSIFKESLRLRGFDAGYVRPPQRELTAGEKKKLAKDLEALGII